MMANKLRPRARWDSPVLNHEHGLGASGIDRVMNKVKFEARLIEGHKGVTVVLVPFDPEEKWTKKPIRLAGRRHGWLVAGTVNGVQFDGYIGERWNRFFIIIDRDLRGAANVAIGDTLK